MNALRPRVWGHRGAMDFAPQNTLPAFRAAVEQGADGVELDVQLTQDGVLVVFHDARVDALTDGRGPLAALPWSVVKTLDAGSHFGRSWAGTRIPTLEDVLADLPAGLTVNVELKTALSETGWNDRLLTALRGPRALSRATIDAARAEAAPLAEALARVIAAAPAGRFVVSSFDPLALEAAGANLPGFPLGFLHSPTVPWRTPDLMSGLTYQAWHPRHSQVTDQTAARERQAGRRIHVWTVNTRPEARRLAALGVDALITNRPADILAALS